MWPHRRPPPPICSVICRKVLMMKLFCTRLMWQMMIMCRTSMCHKNMQPNMVMTILMKERSGNYSNAEDVLICTAWKKVSQDASVGSDQTVNTYWQQIKDYFDERNTSGHFRSSDSLRQCWSMISQGLFQERNMKGEMKEKKIKTFTFHHCYKELKDEEKWKTRETFDASKKKSVVIEDEEDVAAEEMELVEEKALK
uniref:No apical meristem-associated C-terminal domain-containing protein n=1 Tax=Hordeum vulgare subsp. vulgare TaxID=112509 RepID=A0A8I6X5X9_HORVV